MEELTAKHPYAPLPSADHREGERWEEESPPLNMGSEGRRGRLGTPIMALHI